MERGRSLDQRQCPFCYDRVPAAALICRSCGQQLVAELPTLAEAEHLLDEREARRWPTLPALPPIAIPRRAAGRDEPARRPRRTRRVRPGLPGRHLRLRAGTGRRGAEPPAEGATASGDGTPAGRSAASGTPAPEPAAGAAGRAG